MSANDIRHRRDLSFNEVQFGTSMEGDMAQAQIQVMGGRPRLVIDGKVHLPQLCWLSIDPSQPGRCRRMVEDFSEIGFEFFTFDANLGWYGPWDYRPDEGSPWKRRVTIDRAMEEILAGNPHAYVLIRLNADAPLWWQVMHRDEMERFDDGTYGREQSYASMLWVKEASEALETFIGYVRSRPYADRVFAYKVMSCGPGEWIKNGSMDGRFGDYSPVMQEEFRAWIRERYQGDVEALRSAWNDRSIDFEEVAVPAREEQEAVQCQHFRDPLKGGRKAIDYFECYIDTTVRDIETFCRKVKDATEGEQLAGVFYGYLMSLGWVGTLFQGEYHQDHERSAYQRSGNLGLGKILRSPYIDFLSSPYCYGFRCSGGDGTFMSVAESIHLYGKLYFSEDDTRTHLSPRNAWYGRSDTPEESVAVLRRNFSNVLIRGAGYWVLGSSTDHPDILREIKGMREIGLKDLPLERTSGGDGIAVIVDERSLLYESMNHRLVWPLIFKQKSWGFSRIGAPYSLYLLDDLLEGLVPEHKMYIFLNLFYLDDRQRRLLTEGFKRDGKTLVWMPYAGLINERPSAENMSELIGMNVICETDRLWELTIAITNFDHPITERLPSNSRFGTDNKIGPIVWVDDPDAVTLGRLIFNNGRCEPGFCAKELDGFNSVYVGAPNVTSDVLRGIARYAGVHIYSESDDVLYANQHYVAVNTAKGGEKKIELPGIFNVRDAFSGELIARSSSGFAVAVNSHSTRLFRLEPPE